jgi:hypothetical protein
MKADGVKHEANSPANMVRGQECENSQSDDQQSRGNERHWTPDPLREFVKLAHNVRSHLAQ